jgi:hypothetical protein
MNKLKKLALYTIITAGLFFIVSAYLIYMPIISKGTNVAFQSSDGEWAQDEVLIKGRKFENILVDFEAYKIKCNAQNAVLQRITKKPSWYSPSHYYNNYQDPKWLVPYAEAYEHTKSGRYPPVLLDHCLKRGYSDEVWSEAGKRAKFYISKILSHSNSLDRTAKNKQPSQ